MGVQSAIVVIPARLESKRLPRKLLLNFTGKPLIQHTYEAAKLASRPDSVCVATDSEEIADVVRGFGGNVHMTSPDATCGTDRLAELIDNLDADIVVNLQGDEPGIHPDAIDQVIELLESRAPVAFSKPFDVATLATPIRDRYMLVNTANVKVVCDCDMNALYFSRAPLPFARDWSDDLFVGDPPKYLLHLGIYAYRARFLRWWKNSKPSRLEDIEKLEQLRVLESGRGIAVGITSHASHGIDTIGDYEEFVSANS